MDDSSRNPISGKGPEMLPNQGNPFGISAEEELDLQAAAAWEEHRAREAALRGAHVETDELDRTNPGEADPKPAGMVGRPLEAADLPAADLKPADDDGARPPEDFQDSGMAAGKDPSGRFDIAALPAIFSDASFAAPGDFLEALPASELMKDLPADPAQIAVLVTDEDVAALWERIDAAQARINEAIDREADATRLLERLQYARNAVLAGKENYEEALHAVGMVEYRIIFVERVAAWSQVEARRVLFYEIAWLLALGAGLLLVPPADQPFLNPRALSAVIIGGLGGGFGALYALWRHVAEKQDYNPQYNLWYYSQPLMGLPIGGFIYLVMNSGIQFSVAGSGEMTNPAIVYTLAAIAGFQQNVVYDIVRRVLKLFRIGDGS